MAIGDWNAGIIRPNAVAPTSPYEDGAAPGVWTLDQVAFWAKQGLWPTAGNKLSIGLFGGGYTAVNVNIIDRITIGTTGNATDFGDLATARYTTGGCSSSSRGVWGGGSPTGGGQTNVISFVTFATAGNDTDFGDLITGTDALSACGSETRGIFGGGGTAGGYTNVMSYITIASAGNAIDYGDLSVNARYGNMACASPTRAVFAAGLSSATSAATNVIQYKTITSAGNTTDFGDLTSSTDTSYGAGCSNNTRGLFGMGLRNVIEYITIASTGNATTFGNLTPVSSRFFIGACSNSTRGVFAGGRDTNVIEYVTISSTGNSADFGDLTVTREGATGCSSAHGGLS